jgi:very-short-patch-repair endonuclease
MNSQEYTQHLLDTRTRSEKWFAKMLKDRGIYFKEQERVLDYFPDFYFPEHDHRIVELDGKCHLDRKERDRERDAHLRKAGFKVLRVKSMDVFAQPEWLMHRVLMFLKEPHDPVSRDLRVRRKKANRTKLKCTPKWSKVPKLTKGHLEKSKQSPKPVVVESIPFEPSKTRSVKLIKKI